VSGAVARQVYEIEHDIDPKQAILKDLAPYLDDIRIGGPFVLVGVYTREGEKRLKGSGIILPGRTGEEDRYQGITGLVVKMGPGAYQSEVSRRWFGDKPVELGDWVMFDVKHGRALLLGERTCRIIQDTYLDAVLQRPDMAM
jgi:hypothetical protein